MHVRHDPWNFIIWQLVARLLVLTKKKAHLSSPTHSHTSIKQEFQKWKCIWNHSPWPSIHIKLVVLTLKDELSKADSVNIKLPLSLFLALFHSPHFTESTVEWWGEEAGCPGGIIGVTVHTFRFVWHWPVGDSEAAFSGDLGVAKAAESTTSEVTLWGMWHLMHLL